MLSVADLLMPKLGLTMTEGTVAQWAVAPGVSFGADDLVVVIETDKIAYEVKAPSAGRLTRVLVPGGTTVPVGTPIAQWELKVVRQADALVATTVAEPVTESASPNRTASAVSATAASRSNRVIATPYARRLARNAGIDLTAVRASNNRRIRAIDVEGAIAERDAAAPAAQPQRFATGGVTLLGADIAADRLLAVTAEVINAVPDLQPAPVHFAVLAAARALAEHGIAPQIGCQRNDSAPHVIAPEACRTLSVVVAAEHNDTGHGPIALLVTDHADATLIVRTPPSGCGATLGVGAINRLFRPEADGTPVLRAELHLSFVQHDDAALPRDLFGRICSLLENPFVLLAM